MIKVVGIRFQRAGKIYYFDPKNYKMKISDHVIVETARGVEFGRVDARHRGDGARRRDGNSADPTQRGG